MQLYRSNYLHILFLKLFLKNNNYWIKKMVLKNKLILKSFYKNEEENVVNKLIEMNSNILLKFSNSLYLHCYLLKFVFYLYIRSQIYSLKPLKIYKNYFSFNNYYSPVLLSNYFSKIYSKKNIYSKFSALFCLNFFYFIYFVYIISLKFSISKNIKLSKFPNKVSKLTLLRSPHIDKKSREQFEVVTHKSSLDFLNLFNHDIYDILNNKVNSSFIEHIIE